MHIEDCFYIGYISKTRGLKGEVQLYFAFDDYKKLDFDTVFLEIEKKLVPFFVDSFKIQSNKTGYFFFEDVEHIDAAKELLRKSVYLPKSKMPERDENEFYTSDLVGYLVYDEHHGELGEIIAINEYPQQDIAVVHYRFKELMFPVNDDFIVKIDKEQHVLHVDLPEGLVDVYNE
ncbi:MULTISPECIES: ribosome maturation factor RimM [Olivibacter]|uniref:Ribosome maturation factor RimM n=1 Tax=Olivibacter jilunii TaxID=985016 RepID=A0ABW6B8T9_9SPHI|nr:ribosome maturation factor RimM [Olivibacter sp. UJ_SKK_5.1]MDX3912186.1 ribosome maturation factor RimM [Pseudosphingobacterium sp.]